MYCRRLLTIALLLGLSVALVAGPANAWEFSMSGIFTWLYEVRGQNGVNGFFGAYDQAQVSGVTAVYLATCHPHISLRWGCQLNLNGIGIAAPYNFYVGGYHNANVSICGSLVYQPSGLWGNGKPLWPVVSP